jgi:phenylalanyl-tRNA synthetase beta chain
VRIEADLVEEVGRIYGYNQLPTSTFTGNLGMLPVSEDQDLTHMMHKLLQHRGYQEVITYTFVDPDLQKLLDTEHDAIALANPISSDMSVMRTGLWPGLIKVAQYNLNRQQNQIRIFESGLKFISQDTEIKQNNVIAGLVAGPANPEQWGEASHLVDFYDIKSDVEALLDLTADKDQFIFTLSGNKALHPGQSASIECNSKIVGTIGLIHPEILQKLGISEKIFVFELELDLFEGSRVPVFEQLSRFPSIRRDLAIVVDDDVTYQQIRECISTVLPETLKEIRVFDVYKGKGVDSGRKSLALGLILQESSRTLTDQEVDSSIEKIVDTLKEKLSATLRE